jgi:predicted metal-binding protein
MKNLILFKSKKEKRRDEFCATIQKNNVFEKLLQRENKKHEDGFVFNVSRFL